MSTYSITKYESTGVLYAAPTSNTTVRFKNTSTAKQINGVSTKNLLTEIIYNDNNAVKIADVNGTDAVSVRIRVSGSPESSVRISQILLSLASQITTWNSENVFKGFMPTTAPAIPDPE